jgi:hypothetical protein
MKVGPTHHARLLGEVERGVFGPAPVYLVKLTRGGAITVVSGRRM